MPSGQRSSTLVCERTAVPPGAATQTRAGSRTAPRGSGTPAETGASTRAMPAGSSTRSGTASGAAQADERTRASARVVSWMTGTMPGSVERWRAGTMDGSGRTEAAANIGHQARQIRHAVRAGVQLATRVALA